MKLLSTLSITLLCTAILTGCNTRHHLVANVGYIEKTSTALKQKVSEMRYKALTDKASQLGARGALAWRSVQINQVLKDNSDKLDAIFNFNALLLEHNVLPPVISQASNEVNLTSGQSIQFSDKVYRLLQPAHFVTAPPTWHSYLTMNYHKPKAPDSSLLPTTKDEVKVWNTALKKGWAAGLEQANTIFAANIARLNRDFEGMLLYKKLKSQSMVNKPIVATSNLGVTGDQHQLRLNETVLRITRNVGLMPNSHRWQPVLTHVTKDTRH